jgi:signal transduction histidine kinase
MSEDVKKHIFEPFYTTKPVGKGTGLGLSITWEIVQRHQGQMEVTSAPGAGTTFRLTLPIKHTEPALTA